MRNLMKLLIVCVAALCLSSAANADWVAKDGTGATITFKSTGTCASVVCIPVHELVNSSGTEIGTSGAPIRTDPTGTTTQPVSAASLPLPTGAATAANQQSVATWAGGTLGSMANYGTSPGAVLVPGVNAYVTNTPPVSQSGTWTFQPGNTANTTPWLFTINQGGNSATVSVGGALKVDNSANTQPVSAASLPLPSGAATAAKQPALGTAGTPSSDVITVQGASSMTPVKVQQASDYPSTATAITASATGTTAATTATLSGAVGKTTYICSLSIRSNATAAATGDATVTGTVTGTMHYTHWTAPLASGIGVTEQIFAPCVPASATNTNIAVASPAPGSGGTVSVSVSGYQL